MNSWQLAQQIKDILVNATWADGDQENVFGDVFIGSVFTVDMLARLTFPLARITLGTSTHDDTLPDLVAHAFSVQIICTVEGDQNGELAMIGGARSGDDADFGHGRSDGRGILEIEEEAMRALAKLTPFNGITARLKARSAAATALVDDIGHIATRELTYESLGTVERYYHPPQDLSLSGTTLSWTNPPDRFDLYRIEIRESATSTPPATPEAGTEVTLAGNLSTSVDVGSGSGRSWSAWAWYDETSGTPAADHRHSSQETGTTEVE